MPPDITAAITSGISSPIVAPNAKPIGIIMENVPQLVPVENAVILATQKIRRGINMADIFPDSRFAKYFAVPKSPMTFPMRSAKTIMRPTGIISPIPSYKPLK
jgi:hypothetical protein